MEFYHYKEVTSTNDFARHLLDNHKEVVVTADFQYNGRGRNNHIWHGSVGKNLYFSYAKNHSSQISFEKTVGYQAIGSMAARNSLQTIAKNKDLFKIKYPNDVMALFNGDYAKICGVLIEHTFSGANCTQTIVGIGINVQQTDFSAVLGNTATSLNLLNIAASPTDFANLLVKEIQALEKMPSDILLSKWFDELNIIGKQIYVKNNENKWTAKGFLDDGRLLLYNYENKLELIVDNGDSIRYEID